MDKLIRDGLCIFNWSVREGHISYPHVFREGICVRCDSVFDTSKASDAAKQARNDEILSTHYVEPSWKERALKAEAALKADAQEDEFDVKWNLKCIEHHISDCVICFIGDSSSTEAIPATIHTDFVVDLLTEKELENSDIVGPWLNAGGVRRLFATARAHHQESRNVPEMATKIAALRKALACVVCEVMVIESPRYLNGDGYLVHSKCLNRLKGQDVQEHVGSSVVVNGIEAEERKIEAEEQARACRAYMVGMRHAEKEKEAALNVLRRLRHADHWETGVPALSVKEMCTIVNNALETLDE